MFFLGMEKGVEWRGLGDDRELVNYKYCWVDCYCINTHVPRELYSFPLLTQLRITFCTLTTVDR